MNAPHVRFERALACSLAIYRALLRLYPASFRAVYAQQMLQVFRASCVRASREGGTRALARVWRFTLGDLLVSALAERYEEVLTMERRSLTPAAGLAGLIGGVLLLAYCAYLALIISGAVLGPGKGLLDAQLFDTRSPLALPVEWAPTTFMTLVWVCVLIIIAALCAAWPGRGVGVWLAGGVALLGAAMCLIGMLSLIFGNVSTVYSLEDPALAHFDQMSGNGLPLLGSLDLFGRMVVGVGLLALALMGLLSRAVARQRGRAALAMVLGVTSLFPYAYMYLGSPAAILANLGHGIMYGGRLPPTPFSVPLPASWDLLLVFSVVEAGFTLIWGVCLLILGIGFLRSGQRAVVSPSPVLGLAA